MVEKRLKELGLELPQIPAPVAAYVPDVCSDGIVYTSGQLPSVRGDVRTGRLGADMSVEAGYEAARICALNCLAVIKSLAGSLDRVDRVLKVTGFVNSTPEFESQPKVVNGASELLQQVFGNKGIHSRKRSESAACRWGLAAR